MMQRRKRQLAAEEHFSVAEVAVPLKLDNSFVRDLFRSEAGVLLFKRTPGSKRTTMRIPKSTLTKVLARMAVQAENRPDDQE